MSNPGSWFIVENAQDYTVNKMNVFGNLALLTAVPQPGFTPPEGIDYDATPPHLTGLTGIPVDPFVRLPFGP